MRFSTNIGTYLGNGGLQGIPIVIMDHRAAAETSESAEKMNLLVDFCPGESQLIGRSTV